MSRIIKKKEKNIEEDERKREKDNWECFVSSGKLFVVVWQLNKKKLDEK